MLPRLVSAILVFFLLNSCATTQYITSSSIEPMLDSTESATIYVLRPSIYAYAVKVGVYQDDLAIGKLGPKSYLSWKVPGNGDAIEIMTKTENRKRVTLTPLAGETYYLRQYFGAGFLVAGTRIELISEEEGKEILGRMNAPKMKEREGE